MGFPSVISDKNLPFLSTNGTTPIIHQSMISDETLPFLSTNKTTESDQESVIGFKAHLVNQKDNINYPPISD